MATNPGGQGLSELASGTHNSPTEAVGRTERTDQQVTSMSTSVTEDQPQVNPANKISPSAGSSDQIQAPAVTTVPQRSLTSNPVHPSDQLHEIQVESRRPTVPPISTSDQTSYPPMSQSTPLTSTPTRVDRFQPHPQVSRLVGNVERDSQETVVGRRGETTIQIESTPTSTPSPPRTRPPTSESTSSPAVPSQVRIVPDSTLSRSPGRHYTQLQPSSAVFHEEPTTSDWGHDPDVDSRRASHRKNQPLPPVPGRMLSTNTVVGGQVHEADLSSARNQPYPPPQLTRRPQSAGSTVTGGFERGNGFPPGSRSNVAISGPSGNGAPGLSNVSGHGSEPMLGLPRNDTRPTSMAPILSTIPSQPTLERSRTLRSGIDWLVPNAEDKTREKTLGERLDPTLDTARIERDKFASKAKMTGYSLNIAIGLQVVLGAMTTGLSVVTTGKQTSIMTAILGGFATIVASYLARARGSQEPELSITRLKDLEQFIRECEAFKLDFGHIRGSLSLELTRRLDDLRGRFEILLGNSGPGTSTTAAAGPDPTGKAV